MSLKYQGANNCGFQSWYHLALQSKSTKYVSCVTHGMKLLGICLVTFSMLHISSLSLSTNPKNRFLLSFLCVFQGHIRWSGFLSPDHSADDSSVASWSIPVVCLVIGRSSRQAPGRSLQFLFHSSWCPQSHTLTSRELCCTFLFWLHCICF